MKQKQIILVTSLSLLAGFVVQSILVVLLWQVASMEEESSWQYGCAWHQLGPYAKIWVG